MPRKCPCGTQPKFNFPKKTGGVCCSKCKKPGMVNVVNKRCPCGTQPRFNIPEETVGIACAKCKTDEMVNVVDKKCPCGVRPSFNFPKETVGICCKICRKPGMIDVVNKKCPCGTIPSFNMPEETVGVACLKCKTSEMIDVVNKKCPCGTRPVFNFPEETTGVCCPKCKTPEMINVVSPVCLGYGGIPCPVRTHLAHGHEYCMSCDPNEDRRKRFKLYENAFFEYAKDKLDVHQREFIVKFDPSETAKKFARVDGIVIGDGVIVCLEVDENGHQEYECDEHRMHLVTAELLQKYPDNVVSWVRVNPHVGSKNEWSAYSKKKRAKRFDEVIAVAKNILETRDTRVVYIGFD